MITSETCECEELHGPDGDKCDDQVYVLGHCVNDDGSEGETIGICMHCLDMSCIESFVVEEYV